MSKETAPPAAGARPGRAGFVIAQLYYYLAAVVGVGLLLAGLVVVLFGVRALIVPDEFDPFNEPVRTMLHGVALILPGAALLWWHLRQVRRREEPAHEVFWGSSLYFHFVAFLAIIFVVIGVSISLHALAEFAVQECFPGDVVPIGPTSEVPFEGGSGCYPSGRDTLRSVLDGLVFIVAAAPVWWWHLRQGRRLGR